METSVYVKASCLAGTTVLPKKRSTSCYGLLINAKHGMRLNKSLEMLKSFLGVCQNLCSEFGNDAEKLENINNMKKFIENCSEFCVNINAIGDNYESTENKGRDRPDAI